MLGGRELELSSNEFVNTKFSTRTLKILVLILLFVLLLGVNNTYVYYTSLMPFGIGLVFALLFIGFNGYILSMIYTVSSLICQFNLKAIISCLCVVIVLCLAQWLVSKKEMKLKKLYVFGFAILSLVGYMCVGVGEVKQTLAMLVSVTLGLFFLYSCMIFLDATIGKGMLGHISLDEKICGCVILVIFCLGICNTNVYIFSLGLVFATIIIQIVTKLSTASVSLMSGVLVGLGFSIYYTNPIYVSLFVVLSLASISFKCNVKILSVISYILAYVVFCLLFDMGLSMGEVLSVSLGGILYLIVPTKFLTAVADIVSVGRPVAVKNIFNSTKSELVNRVKDLSLVFDEMDKVYRDMVKGNLPDDKAKEMLKEETISGVCELCASKDRCFRTAGSFMDNCFDTIIDMGYEKGKLILLDLPEYLTTNCVKVNYLMQYYNNLLTAYFDYKSAINNIDTSRVLIADQLSGVSKLLETLSREIDFNVSFDNKLEQTLKERLYYSGILCLECVVYEKDIQNKTINLIVKSSHNNVKKIEKVVSKLMGTRFCVNKIQPSQVIGTESLILRNTPKYDIAFGSSVITKTGKVVSGDSHAVVPVGDGKYIMSICDGMGSGKEASSISKLTISLIENFYRAGFDNEIILSSVNKLLSLNEQESFSTIDLCMIDCRKGIYDFVKLGASDGYILRSNGEVEIISSSGLPIGVLEKIKPHITKLCISPMDIVVLVSDGVSDVLGGRLPNIIRNSMVVNPQSLSEEILSTALEERGGVAYDDMTVICVRVFEFV